MQNNHHNNLLTYNVWILKKVIYKSNLKKLYIVGNMKTFLYNQTEVRIYTVYIIYGEVYLTEN